MVAGISTQLCDMRYCVLKIGHNLKFENGVLHFNGLAIVSTTKEIKRRYFLQPVTKEATKRVP